jgi:hypothetical protein
MPFKSEKQRKWMHANEPEMAKKWEKEETIEGKLRNLIKQEIKSINEGFDKYYLSGLLDSRLKKKLEIAIKNLKGKVDGVGTDYIWFRMPSSNVDLLAALITKLDRNKNVWIGSSFQSGSPPGPINQKLPLDGSKYSFDFGKRTIFFINETPFGLNASNLFIFCRLSHMLFFLLSPIHTFLFLSNFLSNAGNLATSKLLNLNLI